MMIDVKVFHPLNDISRVIHLNSDLVSCVATEERDAKRVTGIWVSSRDMSNHPCFVTDETVESLTRRLKSGYSMQAACELDQFDRYCWHPKEAAKGRKVRYVDPSGQEKLPPPSGLLAAMKTGAIPKKEGRLFRKGDIVRVLGKETWDAWKRSVSFKGEWDTQRDMSIGRTFIVKEDQSDIGFIVKEDQSDPGTAWYSDPVMLDGQSLAWPSCCLQLLHPYD